MKKIYGSPKYPIGKLDEDQTKIKIYLSIKTFRHDDTEIFRENIVFKS